MSQQADDPYLDLRVLVHWHTRPGPRALSRRQVVVGPFYEDRSTAEGVVSLNVPFGMYDMKTVIDRLPAHQRPDVIVTMIDSTKTSVPRNLAAIDCPAILISGATHHLEAPLRFMLSVVATEPYALLVGNHLPQHLHFLSHATRNKTCWIPGLWVKDYGAAFREQRSRGAVFVGQTGRFHPFRMQGLEALARAGVAVDIAQMTQEEAATCHGEAVLSLNFSLNGDMNMRVFEVLANGGCLLTDRLAPESGLPQLFRDGEELVCFQDFDDLVSKARRLAGNPREALEIARRGFERYRRDHDPHLKRRQLFSMLLGDGRYPSPSWNDRRAGDGANLMPRILVYEHMQERHREAVRLRVRATSEVDARVLSDLADLPRLSVQPDGPADILLTTQADAASGGFAAMVAQAKPAEIVVTDAGSAVPPPGYAAVAGELTVWKSP